MTRWVCPQCSKGVNASSRPRQDDVKRYCLPCSAKTGKLVKRTAPALERERAAKKARAAAKAKTTTERVREVVAEQRSVGDLDLLAEAKRFWNLSTLKQQARWRKELPEITFRRSARKQHTSGRSWGRRIVVTIGRDPAQARETLLHELIHSVCPSNVHHNEFFYQVLRSAAREAWPDVDWRFNEIDKRLPVYAWDNLIAKRLREHLREHGLSL